MASLVVVTLALAAGVQARIWTSADGSKTFEGELKSYDPATVNSNPLLMGGSGNGHYGGNAETYMNVGEAIGQAMVELLKNQK